MYVSYTGSRWFLLAEITFLKPSTETAWAAVGMSKGFKSTKGRTKRKKKKKYTHTNNRTLVFAQAGTAVLDIKTTVVVTYLIQFSVSLVWCCSAATIILRPELPGYRLACSLAL